MTGKETSGLETDGLLREFERACKDIPVSLRYSFAPSTFSVTEDWFLYPSPKLPWGSLRATLRTFTPRTVLTLLPHLLQLNQHVFRALQEAQLPEISMSPGNPAAALAIVRGLGTEGIVTDMAGALALQASNEFTALSSLRFWHIILPAHSPISHFSPRFGTACYDLHLFPGVSVAYQCQFLGESGGHRYHPSAEFIWKEANGIVYASSTDERPVAIVNWPVSHGRIDESGSCSCGVKTTLEFYE